MRGYEAGRVLRVWRPLPPRVTKAKWRRESGEEQVAQPNCLRSDASRLAPPASARSQPHEGGVG